MTELPYDYEELAYDLYKASSDLLDQLVAMRRLRKMRQEDLAEEMNVSQAYISKIENGKAELTSLLTDYALEVGARIEYKVEPAEEKPEGNRHYFILKETKVAPTLCHWSDNEITITLTRVDTKTTVPSRNKSDSQTDLIYSMELAKDGDNEESSGSSLSMTNEVVYAR